MSIDNDELILLSEQLISELPSASESIRDSVVKAVAGLALPVIGSALIGIVTEEAGRRWKERVTEMMKEFAQRVVRLTNAIESQDYYKSEEFQALLIEALDQERTNRHRIKRKMLAQGLAQSGTRKFAGELEKEIFFRILRDLSLVDIQTLKELSRPTNAAHMGLVLKKQTLERVVRVSLVDTRVYRLQGLGLVTTFQRLPAPNLSGVNKVEDQGAMNRFVANALGAEPQVVISISNFGLRFLDFLLDDDISCHEPAEN